ncbi:DUF1648 domain-containing protein [Candidatus Micrarchaeota archaeon]|nr:DUF1648 domain-containing protein [Candidatus Micrarchaeota archaeon]
MDKKFILAVFTVLVSFIIGLYFYNQLPEKMASHWNAEGQADGYSGKLIGTFLLPSLTLICLIFFSFLPNIDPLKKNFQHFKDVYYGFILVFVFFMFYLFLLTLFWNLGHSFNFTQFILPAFSILFFYIGVVLPKLKQNWFMGIRTPWTISNEMVWDLTHEKAGVLFRLYSIFILFAFFVPSALLFFMAPIFLIAAYLFIYSYLTFKRLVE